jgi:hypothetical protein
MKNEFHKQDPDTQELKILRKKLVILENTYDGILSLEKQDYNYHIFTKWSFNPKEKNNAN